MFIREHDVLRHISSEMRAWRTIKQRFSERLAPDFNLFDFTPTNELSLSKMIGWLLDPGGSHSQGRRFLDQLLDLGGIGSAPRSGPVTIELESWTDQIEWSNRRLDIRVAMDGFVLGIENKPYAAWQEYQIGDYLEDLRRRSPEGYCLLVLKGWSGFAPDPVYRAATSAAAEALRESGFVIDADYQLVADWLRECARECRAARVRMIIEDFADYVDREFLGINNMDETEHLVESIVSDPLLLDAALSLIVAKDILLQKLTKSLIRNVDGQATKSGWILVKDPKLLLNPARGRTGLHFQVDPQTNWTISIEFWNAGLVNGYVGVRMKEPVAASRAQFSSLRGAMEASDMKMKSEEPEDQWPYWVRLQSPLIEPLASKDPKALWLALPTPSFADQLIELVKKIEAGLISTGSLRPRV